jgi:integrase/recombinase XerD
MALELWVDFFDELQHVRGRSQNTVMAYRRDLELYEDFLKKNRGAGIDQFYEFLHKKKLSPRSQARVISSLRTYFRFLDSRGREIPDLRKLRPPKVKAKLPEALSMEDFEKLLTACHVEDALKTARNHITLYLLLGLGCRVTEMIQLNLADFNQTDGLVTITGKGGKQRMVPLTENLLRELKFYLKDVRPQLVKVKTSSILINDRGNRPSRVDVWRWLAAWSKEAGFASPIGPHQFRHGCATQLLESGADLRSIQLLLGHSSLQTTQIYTAVSSKTMREAVDANHPLSISSDEI